MGEFAASSINIVLSAGGIPCPSFHAPAIVISLSNDGVAVVTDLYRTPANAANSVTFDVEYNSAFIIITITPVGSTLVNRFDASAIEISITPGGTGLAGKVSISGTIEIHIGFMEDAGADYAAYTQAPKSNWVGWSKIGDSRILIDRMNEAGYMPLPFNGVALRCMSLGDNCIVYGSDGIVAMVPVNSPSATYGMELISRIGLLHESAVAGSFLKHFFIGSDSCLYRLQVGERAPTKMYYKEFMNGIIPSTSTKYVSMVYDEVDDKLYISSASSGLILTSKGLGGGYAAITSVFRDGTNLYHCSPEAIVPAALSAETDTFDMEVRGLKTFRWVDLHGMIPEDTQVSLGYRYKNSGAFSYTDYKSVNKEGSVFFGITALEFRLRIRVPTYEQILIDGCTVKFTVSDKRSLRSPTMYDRRYDR